MIQKLRKKLILVLMAVVCLFLIGILVGLFVTSKTDYERRSVNAFREPPAHSEIITPDDASAPEEDTDTPDSADSMIGMPIAVGSISAEGDITIAQNQIYYVTEDELIQIISQLATQDENSGLSSQYSLRFRRRINDDGSSVYFFSDTYAERSSLNAQLIYSAIIGLGAMGLFFIVSMLLSRWMVKPVERAWEKQRQFVADASHELKTPLTVVLSNTDMMIASRAVTDEKNRIRLDNIRAESQRMKELVENLLTLARSDNTPTPAARTPVNLSFVVTGATLTLEPTIYDQGRFIDCQVADDVTVMGDGDKLRQLTDILLDNACKYGKVGSSILVRMTVTPNQKDAILSVASEGAPLPPEECLNIFERFYRSDKSRGQEKGYGLGLAIAQSIVKEHGGKIWAQSDGVKTNTFYVKLPCLEAPAHSKGQG